MIFNTTASQMFNKKKLKLALPLLSVVMLAACGGGIALHLAPQH
jgi:hypothetical protein